MQNEYRDTPDVRDPKQPKTVLIVHPSKSLADTLFSFFRALPISAARATTEEEAMYLFGLLRPDLVIVGMPEEWLRLIESFRSAQPSPEIIVLVDSDDLAEKARGMGFENVVLSDESPEALADTVQLFLGNASTTIAAPTEVTVLVVDDEGEIVDMIARYLIGSGYKVVTAQSGKTALEILRRDPSISIVLVDLIMPDMGGLETLRELKSSNKHVGVILMSAFADREIVRQAFKLGAFDFLLKPIEMNQLESSIGACVARMTTRKESWWKWFTASG
ncbi:MAG TPA: response regulator [Terriglobia bacterium]|nr:response regulator [Terriglobia bacterium]